MMHISRKYFYLISLYVLTVLYLIIVSFSIRNQSQHYKQPQISAGNWRNLPEDDINKLSELGKILFLDKRPPSPKPTTFKILIWNDVFRIERRHIKRFGNHRHNPWENCLVNNCKIISNRNQLDIANAVLIPIQLLKSIEELPTRRSLKQIWIMLTDESPYNPFRHRAQSFFLQLNGLFNWTMTYRMDSDIPVPYGRTVKKMTFKETKITIPYVNPSKEVHTVILSSNCGGVSDRWKFINELKKHIPIDIIGACGKKLCPGHFFKACDAIKNYTFYLAFENSRCVDYLTEKIWWNAYHNNLIPIILGPSIENCKKLLPPNSYIHVDQFSSPRSLAKYLTYLISSPEEFRMFFEWKHNFTVLNEHGYFESPSFHLCRICEALNFNKNETKIYDHLEKFWNVKTDCNKNDT